MASLRTAIGNRLPPYWTNRLRGVVRALDQAAGLPLAPLRPGAICMWHVARCGSSVLGNLLAQHPGIRWDREIYFHRWTRSGRTFEDWDSERFLRRQMWAAGHRYYGYEMKFLAGQHLAIVGRSLPMYVAECERAGVTHHIVLERRNGLRRMVSEELGIRTKRRHAGVDEEIDEPRRVRLDTERMKFWRGAPFQSLTACLDEMVAAYAELRTLLAKSTVLELTFEDDIAAAGPEHAYERVCGFLGVAPRAAVTHTRRLHPQPVSELIENFDEVAAALRNTPHEWMLDD